MELFEKDHTGCEADPFQPLRAYLRKIKSGKVSAPYIPECKLLPLHQLCELAHLWREAGLTKEAEELGHWLRPLAAFPTLWCPEKLFNEEKSKRLFSLLTVGKEGDCPFNLTLLKTESIDAALTLSGNGTSLGVIRTNDAEIRAFGPQGSSLKFGIQGEGMNGWTRCFALPEVWLEMKAQTIDKTLQLDFRFVGLQTENPLSLSFYVKADSCQIGKEILKPKSLRRFNGETNRVQLNQMVIETTLPHKIQVIPLAGEGCFWNCEFLVSFEMAPCSPQTNFFIQ